MQTITATEFSKNFGRYREMAQREPVAVTSHDRITGYFLSPTEYEEYTALKAKMTRAYAVTDLPAATIEALRTVKMDARHDHLNTLIDE